MILLFFVFPVLIMIMVIYVYGTKNKNYWKNLGVPHAKPIFLFGNLLPLIKQQMSRSQLFESLYFSTTHPYYGFFTLNKPSLLLRDPELIKRILIKDFDYFTNRIGGKSKYDAVGANLLFFLKDDHWRKMRYQLSAMFSSGRLRNMLPFLGKVGENLVKHINKVVANQEPMQCMNTICMYNTDIIASCFFGFSTEALNNGDTNFHIMSMELVNSSFLRTLQTSCAMILPKIADMFRMTFFDPTSQTFLQNIFLKVLKKRKENGECRKDLVDLLIKIQKQKAFSIDEVVAQPLQFHFAGFDTTCNTIAFSLFELCLNPTIQTKLRTEIIKVLTKHNSLSYEALTEMNYLSMVLSEILRFHPIVPILDRLCTKPYNIPNTNLVIEKETPIVVSVYGMHHNSAYFPEPEKFDPERFSLVNKANIIPGTYIPFGDGPRNCIGMRFGLLAVRVALIKIISNFEIMLGEAVNEPIQYDRRNIFLAPSDRLLDIKFKPLKNINN